MRTLDAASAGFHTFTADAEVNFQLNRWLENLSPHGMEDLRSLGSTSRSHEQWRTDLLALAQRVRADGRPFDAAYYLRAAEFFTPPTHPDKQRLRREFLSIIRSECGVTPISIPYEDGALHAYDLQPEGPVTGTWVVFGGFDSYIEEFLPILHAALSAGRRVIAFEGPGQGSVLEDYGLVMTPRWDLPTRAVLDYFALDAVTLVGISLGGLLAINAAPGEPRVRRAVAWNSMDDYYKVAMSVALPGAARLADTVSRHIPMPILNAALRAIAARRPLVDWGLWQGQHVFGAASPAEFLRKAATMHTRATSPHVRADVLLLQGNEDHYVPADQHHRQGAALTGVRSLTMRTFTAAEAGQHHCQVGNMALALRTIVEWEQSLER
ncbi:MAG: alpha/beta hydrolase [Actinomycetaceae bacterium]|nr:alpha/beta hydrolase [Actinomycetaceae bacterium]